MTNIRFLKTFFSKKLNLMSMLVFILLAQLFVSQQVLAEMKGFEDFNGKPQIFDNYLGKGKWLVVMLWRSDCHICNREAHEYVDFHMIHSDTDATVLGISNDGESRIKEAKAFVKRHNIDFPNLIAEPEFVADFFLKLTGQYFSGTPSFLIFSPEGELKAAQVGAVPTPLIEEFIKKNSVKKVVGE